jgi:Na+-driven multidrug efflux pump
MSFDIIPKILSVGISGMVMQIMPAIQMSIMFKVLSNYGGNDSVIIMSASYRVMTFAFIALWGISQGVQPVIGANYGANKFDRIKKTFLSFTGIALGISFSFWLFFMLFPKFILSWFITDNNIIIHGVTFYRIFLSVFLLYGLMPMAITFFQAIGKGGKAAVLVVGRQILFFIPLIFILPIFFGELGAWLAMPIGDFLTLILSLLLIKKTFNDIKTKKREFETLTSQAID